MLLIGLLPWLGRPLVGLLLLLLVLLLLRLFGRLVVSWFVLTRLTLGLIGHL